MTRYQIVITSVLIVLLGTSCGNKINDSGDVGIESARDSNVQRQTEEISPTDPATEPEISASLDLQDMLVYINDYKLYVWDLEHDKDPHPLDFYVGDDQMYTDPSEKYVVFSRVQSNQFGLYRLDLETQDVNLIANIRNQPFPTDWSIISWSPDQNWLLVGAWYSSVPLGFVRIDGSSEGVHKLASNWRPTYWTTENQIILTEVDDQLRATERRFYPIESVSKIDPTTDTQEDLTAQLDLDFINEARDYLEQGQRLSEALQDVGIELSETNPATQNQTTWLGIQYPSDFGENGVTGAALYCNTWQIGEWDLSLGADSEPVRIIHEFENTAVLTNLTHLSDSSVLFINVEYPDCKYGKPLGQLIHMQPDGSFDVISENIVSAGDTSAFRGVLDGTRFILSPDEQHVLWFHQGENGVTEEKTIYITDLNTNESLPLAIDGAPIKAISQIVWVEN